MKFKFDLSNFVLAIVGLTVSLLIFANLAPEVSDQLVASNYTSNTLAGVIVPLITVVFVVGVMIQVLRTAMGKK